MVLTFNLATINSHNTTLNQRWTGFQTKANIGWQKIWHTKGDYSMYPQLLTPQVNLIDKWLLVLVITMIQSEGHKRRSKLGNARGMNTDRLNSNQLLLLASGWQQRWRIAWYIPNAVICINSVFQLENLHLSQ